MRALRLAFALLAASCVVVDPGDLERTACMTGADCPKSGDTCCVGYCRPVCSTGNGLDGGADAGDSGTRDAAVEVPDSGAPDAGGADAGPRDSGAPDAGPPDAGGTPDAGPPDAGPPDAGTMLAANGAPCSAGGQCVSNYCAHGVCCDGACTRSCERCDKAGRLGQCTTADAGAPFCPAMLTCDGTSADCPIPCGSCPSDMYCLTGFDRCRPKLTAGRPCTGAVECLSTFCTDGVCCDGACGNGAADCQACSVARGAGADGTCALLSTAVVCRAATGTCDLAEHCTGASAACPGDAKAAATTTCAATQVGACTFGSGFSCTGDQVETQWRCDGAGTCASSTATLVGTAACTAQRDMAACAAPTYSACRYAQTCSTAGDRDRIDSFCSGGACTARPAVLQANDPACGRSTDGGVCGMGLRCSSGQCACEPAACGAAFAPSGGCCDGNICRNGASLSACGGGGGACSVCGGIDCCGVSPGNPSGPNACRLVCL